MKMAISPQPVFIGLIGLVFSALFIFSSPSWAGQDCKEIFNSPQGLNREGLNQGKLLSESESSSQAPLSAQVVPLKPSNPSNKILLDEQIKDLVLKAPSGIAGRGFLGNFPAFSAETGSMTRAKGIMRWGLRIYLQPNLESAAQHAQKESDVLMQGVYLIGDLNFLNTEGSLSRKDSLDTSSKEQQNQTQEFVLTEAQTKNKPREAFRRLVENGLYYFGDGKLEKIDSSLVKERINPEELQWMLSETERGFYLYQQGWFFPKVRGIISYQETINSISYKNVRKEARRLMNKGFRFTFNTAFKKALDKLAHQKRKGQEAGSSRYKDPELYQETLDSFALGKAFSLEVWNEKGELVGGTIGNREGNLFSPDSVFYDNENYKDAINFAKIAVLILTERLHQAGIDIMDTGMVTPFTASMKGRLISGSEFLEIIQGFPEQPLPVDFSEWKPLLPSQN